MIPVKPSQLRALIPAANAPFCDVLRLFWQWGMQRQILRNYCFNSDGVGTVTLTDNFKADICNDINLSSGCANLMSNPTPPPYSGAAFRALIPPATATLCLKTQPAIVNFMEADTRDWEWMFTESSGVARISEPFRAALCTLGCLGGGGTTACPGFVPTMTLVPGNAKVTINYVGQGIAEVGYTYEIYSAATQVLLDAAIASGVGSAIDTDTMTGASFSYEHTGLTNGDTYFYYVRVRKNSGCAWLGTPNNPAPYVIPSECRLLNLAMDVIPGEAESKTLTIQVRDSDGIGLPAGSTYSVYRGTTALTLTTLLGSGAIGDASHDGTDSNGKVCLSFEHTDTAVTGAANNFYFTVKIKEAAGCTEYTLGTPNGSPVHYPMASPTIEITNWSRVDSGGRLTAIRFYVRYVNPNSPANTTDGRVNLDLRRTGPDGVTLQTFAMVDITDPITSNTEFVRDIPITVFNPAILATGSSPAYSLWCQVIPRTLQTPAYAGGDISGASVPVLLYFN